MDRNELLGKVAQHLRLLKTSSVYQEPYTGDFFGLFAAAFNAGLLDQGAKDNLSADVLLPMLYERMKPGEASDKAREDLYSLWSAWTYAAKHRDQLSRGAE